MFRLFTKFLRNVKFKRGLTGVPVIAASLIDTSSLKKTEFQDPKLLTHSFLIQQASSVAVNGATQLLTQTVLAVIDTSEKYKDSLNRLLGMLEESNQNSNSYAQQELADLIIAARSQANNHKRELVELLSLLEYVEKVVVSTAEASFLVGAEYASTTLGERMHSAKMNIDKVRDEVDILEQQLLRMQHGLIVGDKEKEL